MSEKSGTGAPAITLPAGGGALAGLGETVTPDLFTGAGSLDVPLELPPGRHGFQPRLGLSYSTTAGAGPYGLGWAVPVPSVQRKTSAGVPRYADDDVFVLAGEEDLVPVGTPEPGTTRYRPRTEGLFARVDRVRRDGADTWRVSSRDGLVSSYGGVAATVADPAARSRAFRWLLTETTDPFGNRIRYDYQRDTGPGPQEEWDQLYLRRVSYVDVARDRFLVTVTFTYEQRPDPLVEHRAGFAVRTRLRCRRIEVRTHAHEELLTRTYELAYVDELVARGERPAAELPANGTSLLARIRIVGHDGDRTQELPPLEFGYTSFEPGRQRFQPVRADRDALPPRSLADPGLETVSLFGNGLPDLVQLDDTARFWRNLGGGRFDRPQPMAEVPAGVRLADPGVQLADLDGDGLADLLALPRGGYFPLSQRGRWGRRAFVRYPSAPAVPFDDGLTRLVDLDGDGVVDALRTGTAFELFFHHPQRGWDRVETRPRRPLADFPDVSFADPRVKLADLDGDGLPDIVLVQPGRIDYWPSLGHGRWGRRVTTTGPVFADDPPLPAGFDPRRVLLGDLDGDGLADLVYVQARRVTCWLNQGGGGWSEPVVIEGTPAFTDVDGVRLVDLLGTGLDGLLWTSDPVPGTGEHYRFLDLTGGLKPYLLSKVDNGRGAVTTLRYTTSTAAYLADQAAGTAWATPLPVPVHVLDRMEVVDRVSECTLSSSFRYHHGYWDGVEREFRGFGLVEQLDAELSGSGRAFCPPLLTRTWFHQGPVGDPGEPVVEPDRSAAAWPEDPPALGHGAAVNRFLAGLPAAARRDALRALRGKVLRAELYARDGSPRQDRPYTVTEHAYALREEDPPAPGADRRRVFFPHQVASRSSQWERGTEPMTRFTFTDEHDRYGHAGREIELAVPRGRDPGTAAAAAEPYLGTVTTTRRAVRDDADRYIVDRVAAVTTHEIRNDGRSPVAALVEDVRADRAGLAVSAQVLTRYDGAAFTGRPVGELGDFGAPVRTETLVLPEEALRAAYREQVPPYLVPGGPVAWTADHPPPFRELLPALAGYAFSPGDEVRGYFVTSGRRYDVQDGSSSRGLVTATRDALGRDTDVGYDDFGMLAVRVVDPAGLVTEAVHDYRVLRPRLVTDPNGNRSAATYTPLGLPESIAVMGRAGEAAGDTPARPGTRLVYDLAGPGPVSVRTIRRVHHATDTGVPPAERDRTVERVEFSDGLGRLVQTRTRAEDDVFGDPTFGSGVLDPDPAAPAGDPVTGRRAGTAERPSVVVSGWLVYDNKGRVVEAYEPFRATGWDYAQPGEAERGLRTETSYDPCGQVVRTVGPDGSEQRVVLGVPDDLADPERFTPTPWQVYSYDANDNAGRTAPTDAAAYRHHWDTPDSVTLDALGRLVSSVQRHREPAAGSPVEELETRFGYDIRGALVSLVDAAGRTALRCVPDLTGRALRTESIDAGTRRTVYDAAGHLLERRDGRGALSLQLVDRLGRPGRLWARDDAAGPVTLREVREYGDGGDPGQPAAERAASRAANRLGRLRRQLDDAGQLTVGDYDLRGNALERTRRVLADAVALAGAPVDWQPPPGRRPDAHADALLEPEGYRTTTAYDALDRLTAVRYPPGVDGTRPELRPGYDAGGALRQVGLDDRVVVERIAYDARGQPTLVALGNGVMTRHAYHPRTLRLARLRSERYTQPGPTAYRPAGRPLQDLAYRHDPAGNVLEIVDRTPGTGVAANPDAAAVTDPELRALVARGDALVRRFDYDPLYRLTAATGRSCAADPGPRPWAAGPPCGFGTPDQDNAPRLTRAARETYDYDAAGNLTRVRRTVGPASRLAPVAGSNRLRRLTVGSTVLDYAYDDNGNLTAEATSRRLSWDCADRLVGFRTEAGGGEPSVQVRYLYDADGRRTRKLVRTQDGAVTVTTYLDGAFEHHRWPGGENTEVHVTAGGQRVAQVRLGPAHPDDRGPAVRYHLADHAGSSAVVLDQDGGFVNREEYTPYGESSFGGFARKRYRFTGAERDAESGLDYRGARYYAPWLGRWVSPDPDGLDSDGRAPPLGADGPNPYWYARGNPVTLADPTGRQAVAAPHKRADIGPIAAFQRAAVELGLAEAAAPAAAAAETTAAVAPTAAPVLTGSAVAGAVQVVGPGAAILGVGGLSLTRQNSIAQYGNPYGPEPGMGILQHARALRQLPTPTPGPPEAEERPERPRRQAVNLDTSALVAMSQLKDPWLAIAINAALFDKHLVATRAALAEFTKGNLTKAGPAEKALAAIVLRRVDPIANDPSERVRRLHAGGKKASEDLDNIVDRIVFGTGDKRGIPTVSGDRKFPRRAASQGVVLLVWPHPPAQFAGK